MPLQREFKGLADHTGLYLAGKVPIDLAQALMPVVDIEDFVNPPQIIRWSGNFSAQGVAVSSPVVPEGEMHRVRWIAANFSQAVGATSSLAPQIFHLDQFFGLREHQNITATAGTDQVDGIYLGEMPLVLLPGMGVSWNSKNYSGAGNITVNALYQFQRIGI